MVSVNSMFYESHKAVIEKVLKELGHSDKVDDMVKKYLDKPDIKMKTDPNKPKRPKSAFLLFCDDERPKLIEKQKKNLKAGEKFNLGDIQKKLGSQWGKLSDDKKKKYNEQCETCKETYFDKMSEYESQLDN
tara:strand:+ start:430 stop:825 length:396 start_codon:yes stop_codon:yes gene_type:complete